MELPIEFRNITEELAADIPVKNLFQLQMQFPKDTEAKQLREKRLLPMIQRQPPTLL